jgi:hypothetical protein
MGTSPFGRTEVKPPANHRAAAAGRLSHWQPNTRGGLQLKLNMLGGLQLSQYGFLGGLQLSPTCSSMLWGCSYAWVDCS